MSVQAAQIPLETPQIQMTAYRDIQIFERKGHLFKLLAYISSLNSTRAVDDVFKILDIALTVEHPNAFHLQEVDGSGNALPTIHKHGAPGVCKPGAYLIVPLEEGVVLYHKDLITFTSPLMVLPNEGLLLPHSPKKKRNFSSLGTVVLAKDNGPQGFEARLIYRDKGCVVCCAEGIDSKYQYDEDFHIFEGCHIFPLANQDSWTLRKHQDLITDPYTDSRKENATWNNQDGSRMNSLENGILLCLFHCKAYNAFWFTIHPKTHKMFAFYPAVAHLHGLEVTEPWKRPNPLYPAPHAFLLQSHFETAISKQLFAAEELDLDNDDDDNELEFMDSPANHHNEWIEIETVEPDWNLSGSSTALV